MATKWVEMQTPSAKSTRMARSLVAWFLVISGGISASKSVYADAASVLFRGAVSLNIAVLGQNEAADEKENNEGDDNKELPDAGPALKLLRRIFNPNAPVGPNGEGGGEGRSGRNRDRDFIDSRAPHDLKVEQMMRAAEVAIRRKEWKTAQELLQRLLDLPEDSLYRLPDGRWQSVRRSANQMLGSAPKQFLEDYQTQNSGLAQQLLNDAKRSGRTSDYVSVANRFLHTPAGYEAANYLGSLHFDRGEFGLAAAWFDEISRSSAALSSDGAWRVKAALASRQAGNVSASQKLLEGLSNPAGQRVNLGLGGVEPGAWVGGTTAVMPTRSLVLSDWTQIYGTIARLGTAAGSEPLLSPLWSVPLTNSYPVRKRLNWIMQDLADQGKHPVLAAIPLVVDGRVIYRDLRGVRAVDIETGRSIWESQEGISPERIVGGLPQQSEAREAWRFRMNPFQNDFNEFQGQSVEYHPLSSLLFRDGIYGLISSDGQQVFVIEDHGLMSRNQPGQHWGWDGANEPQDPYGVPWKTNRLVSYDLKTGRPRWSVGGIEAQESFDLPLAGSYFYGTPAVDGDELLLVAGKGDDVRLWSLDRATGTPRWSQLIAYTDTKIEQDIGRRWFNAQVAADGGVIVCPTTVGWLVAVDRLRQSVLWAHRYLPPTDSHERDPSNQFVQQRELSFQWAPSAPIISGSTVVYTPPEEPIVLALNLLDGKRLWEKPKDSWTYLAGVFGDRVVLVGQTEVGAFNLTTGKADWTSPLGDDIYPSGRGQAVEDLYYLPLSNGELRVLDLKSGKKTSHGYLPSNHAPLGNLAMHHGKLVALGTQGLVGFGQRDAVIAEIQRRKGNDPNDAWALLRDAEIHLLNREYALALPLLQSVNPDGLSPEDQTSRRSELLECLATVIRQDPEAHPRELEELGRLAQTAAEKRLHQELMAESLIAQSKFLEAFETLWATNDSEDVENAISRTDDAQVFLAPQVWLASRLMELWTASTGENRQKVDAKIEALLAEGRDADAAIRKRLLATLGFHPSAAALQESAIEELAKAEDFSGAQLELLKLAANSNRTVAGRATARLARLMEQFQLAKDAGFYYRSLENEFADVNVEDGVTGLDLVQRLRAAGKIDSKNPARAAWDESPLKLVQGPVQYVPPAQEISRRSSLPFFDPLTVEVQQQEQRLAFEVVQNGQFEWLAPLRSSPRNHGDGYSAAEFLGHELVIINRDVLHVVSPVEKRVLWSKTLDGAEGAPFWRHASRPPQLAMSTARRNSDQHQALLQQVAFTGRLVAVQPSYICVYGRRSITLLDPRTGGWLWRREGIPQDAQIVGNRDMVCVVPSDSSKAEAYRSSDGKLLKIERLGSILANALQLRGDSALLLEQGPTFQFLTSRTTIRLHQPLTGEDRWKAEFPSKSLVSALDDDELLVVPPDGKVERVEIASGKRTPLEPINFNTLKGRRTESFAMIDDDHIYFIANVQDTTGMHHYGESLPSVRANGAIFAWNRSDGKLAWRQDVKNQNLVIDRFHSSPVLLFVSRSWKQKGNLNYGTLSIQAIHKKSGKVLHNTTTPSMFTGFHSLEVNYSEPSIELKSYNLRMRLVPTNEPVAEAKPADAVVPANVKN